MVALQILGQQDEVVAALVGLALLVAQPAARDVDLAADDGLDPGGFGGFIKVNTAVHHAVVGDGTGGHAKRLDALDELWNAARAVQQGIFRVQMQVGETHGTSSDKINFLSIIPPFFHLDKCAENGILINSNARRRLIRICVCDFCTC